MLSNAEIGKCHFDKCKALCTHRLNFDGFLPRRGPPFLIYMPWYKNVKQWCYREQIQMSLAQKKRLRWTCGSLFAGKHFLSQDRQPCEAFLKTYKAIFSQMLHKPCILIWPVTEYLHGEINANDFALVQTEVWAYCQAFDAGNGSHSYLQASEG